MHYPNIGGGTIKIKEFFMIFSLVNSGCTAVR